VFSCDYNGWTDLPEEQREALDALEEASRFPVAQPQPLAFLPPLTRPSLPVRKAA
jgi:hypothetical protein